MPIRTRLAAGFSALVAVVLIFMGTGRYIGQKELLIDNKDFSLKVAAGVISASVPRTPPSPASFAEVLERVDSRYPELQIKAFIIQFYDRDQNLLFSSAEKDPWAPFGPEMWKAVFRDKTVLSTHPSPSGSGQIRILMKTVLHQENPEYLMALGSSMNDIEIPLRNFLAINLIFVPITALLIGAGGWWLTRMSLKPLEELIESAERFSSGELGFRIARGRRGKEIEDLSSALNRMSARLETSFKQIRDFTENVSHELKMPLSILRGEAEVALRRKRTPGEYRETLESGLEEIGRMEKIVDRLLFLARAERGETDFHRELFDLSGLAEEVIRRFKRAGEEKGVSIQGPEKGPFWFHGDPHLLEEVLVNLLQNALAHTRPGDRIDISLKEKRNRVELSVSDTGAGIPQEALPHIFERFFQVDKSHSTRGSGLGLSIVQVIINAHRGKVTVTSREGEGSCFIVSLPSPHRPDIAGGFSPSEVFPQPQP